MNQKPYNKSLINLVCSICMGKYFHSVFSHRPRDFLTKISQLKLRLHTAINQADFVSWCMLYTCEGNKMQSWENDDVRLRLYH